MPHKTKRQYREWRKEHERQSRKAAIAYLGGRCVRCKFSDVRALQIDHVFGDGFHRRKTVGSYTLYKQILSGKFDHIYQLLCANCNWIKRAENSEYGW